MRIIGVVGWQGSGKTTLVCRLIPALIARGIRVSTLKHAHHGFDVDQPGKDSWAHRAAGASEVLVASANRWALMHELRGAPEPTLAALLSHLEPVDLVVVEGFKREPHPKLETWRNACNMKPLNAEDPAIVAVASDTPIPDAGVPVLDLDDVAGIAEIVLAKARPFAAIPWRGTE